jgi:predicted SprT family Zn-dependent metalloprotease
MTDGHFTKNKEIYIGILTVILTAILSGVVVKSQLSKEHDYWAEQRGLIRREAYLDKRLELMEEINRLILKLEISAKEIKINHGLIISKLAQLKQKKETDISSKEWQNVMSQIVKYRYDIADYSSKTQMAVMYFGSEVTDILGKVATALENNYSRKYNYLDKLSKFLKDDKKQDVIEFSMELVNSGTINTTEELKKARMKLLKAMITDIQKSHPNYKSNN